MMERMKKRDDGKKERKRQSKFDYGDIEWENAE